MIKLVDNGVRVGVCSGILDIPGHICRIGMLKGLQGMEVLT